MGSKILKQLRVTGGLTREELFVAETVWIKSVQSEMKQQESFEQLKGKLGVVDEEGVLGCKGRLCNAELEGDASMPILLPRGNRLTDLIVLDCHGKVHQWDESYSFRVKVYIT